MNSMIVFIISRCIRISIVWKVVGLPRLTKYSMQSERPDWPSNESGLYSENHRITKKNAVSCCRKNELLISRYIQRIFILNGIPVNSAYSMTGMKFPPGWGLLNPSCSD